MIPRTGISVSKKELLVLLAIFIVYVLMGGISFMLLESPLEERLRKELEELRTEFEEKLSRLEQEANVTRVDMEKLILRLAVAHSNSLIDEGGNDTHTNWSFDNSFFFAITVVTTIGYGHLSPSTMRGRLFCLLYATIGIPLTGILLAAIGGHYSEHLVKRLQQARKTTNSRWYLFFSASTWLVPWLLVFLVIPAGLFTFTEGWSFEEGLYYCFITLSTIGFGDYVAGNFKGKYIWVYKIAVVLWIIFGLGYLAMILNYISRAMRCKQVRKMERKVSSSIYHTQQKVGQRLEEVCSILQDLPWHRPVKPRGKPLKRIQSFPVPELKERNHTIRNQFNTMHVVKEGDLPLRLRRMSLPLLDTTPILYSCQRGSLQMVPNQKEWQCNHRNGFQISPQILSAPLQVPLTSMAENQSETNSRHLKIPEVTVVDVLMNEQSVGDVVCVRQTIIDMEDLQCTRV